MHQDRLSYGQVGDQDSPKQVFQLFCMSEDVHNGMFKGGKGDARRIHIFNPLLKLR